MVFPDGGGDIIGLAVAKKQHMVQENSFETGVIADIVVYSPGGTELWVAHLPPKPFQQIDNVS